MVTLQHRFKYIQGLHVLQKEPKLRVLVLDIWNACNYNCIYCYGKADSFTSNDSLITIEKYEQLFKEAKTFGVKTIWFLGGHENSLNPIYFDLLKIIEELELFSVSFVNGSLFSLDPNAYQKIFSLKNSSVVIKVDSLNPQRQNFLTGNKKSAQYLKTAIDFLAQKSRLETNSDTLPRIGLSTVLTKFNYLNIPQIFELALQNNWAYFCDGILKSGQAENKDLEPSREQIDELLQQLQIIIEKFHLNIQPKQVINFYDQECLIFDNYIFITPEGLALPCAGFPEINNRLGHINEGLATLWQRKKALIEKYYSLNCTNDKCPCRVHLEDKTI
ncbi:MAG: radical SAM protein [Patescibacteria group bacterium]